MEDLLQTTVAQAKDLLGNPKNKQALAIAGLAYYVSKDHKERNAVLAGLGALVLLPEREQKN